MNYDSEREAREYNSPANQAQRMREAGVNPDLIGVDNVAGDSPSLSPMTSPAAPAGQTPQEMRMQKTNQAMGIAKQFLDILPQAVSMFNSINSTSLDNSLKRAQIGDFASDIALKDLTSIFKPEDFARVSASGKPEDLFSSDNMDSFEHLADRFSMSYGKRNSKYYRHAIRRLMDDWDGELKSAVYEKHFGASSNRKNFLDVLGSFGFDLDDDTLVGVIREFNSVVYDNAKKRNANTKKSLENESKGLDNDAMLSLMSKANTLMDSDKRGDQIKGGILYFVAVLLQSRLSFSSSDNKYGNSTSFNLSPSGF